ncbi:MAG: type II secretion system F family protein [Verrucomicrobiota bacterium]
MKTDEFAFFNQQLATMLSDGLPLEGALQRLCAEMGDATLKTQLQALEADLRQGKPLAAALAARTLPEFYKRMILVGVQSNDLPGVLLLMADYYQRQHATLTRLKGLLVYPLLVLIAAFGLSLVISILWGQVIWPSLATMFTTSASSLLGNSSLPLFTRLASQLWAPPLLFALALLFIFTIILSRRLRTRICWRLPAFRDASVAQASTALWIMLKSGVTLRDALALIEQQELGTPAGKDITVWRQRLAAGHGQFAEIAAESHAFPALFVWMVSNSGADLTTGFKRAAEIYQGKFQRHTETLLYAVLPAAIIALGLMIAAQGYMAVSSIAPFLKALISVDGM